MIFNESKTKYVVFKSDLYPRQIRNIPDVFMNDVALERHTQLTYLGVVINEDGSSDLNMSSQARYLNGKANVLSRQFHACNDNVKRILFKTFCSNIYMIQLNYKYTIFSDDKLKVAYNSVFRKLFGLTGIVSISREMVSRGIPTYGELKRIALFKSWRRMSRSKKCIIEVCS